MLRFQGHSSRLTLYFLPFFPFPSRLPTSCPWWRRGGPAGVRCSLKVDQVMPPSPVPQTGQPSFINDFFVLLFCNWDIKNPRERQEKERKKMEVAVWRWETRPKRKLFTPTIFHVSFIIFLRGRRGSMLWTGKIFVISFTTGGWKPRMAVIFWQVNSIYGRLLQYSSP